MTARPTACVVKGDYHQAIAAMFWEKQWGLTTKPKEADLVVFTGGADVSPGLYGQEPITETVSDEDRDEAELNIWAACEGIPKVGICRGAQFLHVCEGNSLWQHVIGHNFKPHPIKHISSLLMPLKEGSEFLVSVTSLHHQMMGIPSEESRGNVVAVANRSPRKITDQLDETNRNFQKDWADIEVVWYPEASTLCYQPHPELDKVAGKSYFFELIRHSFGLSGT